MGATQTAVSDNNNNTNKRRQKFQLKIKGEKCAEYETIER